MKIALDEVKACFKSFPIAAHFAWGDTKARYRRSLLGPFWIVLSTAIGVAGLGILWSTLLKMDKNTFIPSLTIGLVIWQLIAGCIVESPTVFLRNAMLIRNLRTPFLLFPVQMLLRQLINFLHNCLVILVVLCIYPPAINGLVPLLSLLGLLLVLGNLLWMALLIGMLGARYRDIDPLLASIMPMLFFLSPVIYRPDHLIISPVIVWANPFTYLIGVIRDPLQGIVPSSSMYYVTIGMLVMGWFIALSLLNYRRNRIAFWVG
jgi:ABC-type polysaccharide/polyol phosphate export permease